MRRGDWKQVSFRFKKKTLSPLGFLGRYNLKKIYISERLGPSALKREREREKGKEKERERGGGEKQTQPGQS